MGHEVYVWHDDEFKEQSTESQEKLCEELKKGYDLVFSYNFFRIVAQACHEREIPYFSWTQDSPLLSLYDINAYYDTNYFFCFDYEQLEGMKKRGNKKKGQCYMNRRKSKKLLATLLVMSCIAQATVLPQQRVLQTKAAQSTDYSKYSNTQYGWYIIRKTGHQ